MRLHLLLATFALMPLCAAAQTYKCTQADGKVAFQGQPCQGTSTGSQITVRPTAPSATPAEIEKMKAATSRAGGPSSPSQQAVDEAKAKNQQIDAYNRSVRCENARRNLDVLNTQRPVFRYDNKGERQYLEDANRQSELAAAQKKVAVNCN